MNCPFCKKEIQAFTGFQEVQKFQAHLLKCKKNPDRKTIINQNGRIQEVIPSVTLKDALNIRAESGQ